MFIATGHLVAQVLLTLGTIGYGFVPILADFNATHATNPQWKPHARFHVWQVTGFALVALIGLALIWSAGAVETERLYLAGGLGAAALIGFFGAMAVRPVYGGALHDQNGYPPFKLPFGPPAWRWDANVTVFGLSAILLVIGLVAI